MAGPASIAAWLEELGRPAADRDYRPGHARMKALLQALDLHRPRLRVRIAGTNGKGSTANMLARALAASGFRVGLYTSPHLLRFNERIRINGEPIDDASLYRCLEALMPQARASGASYFEVATAAALAHFSERQTDVEILEAGVGARLDATTAVPADVALITPIGLDHQAWLGESLQEIAAEKASAMEGCRLCLSALQHPEVEAVLCREDSGLRFVSPHDWPGELAMPGTHQRQNAALALACIRSLGRQLPGIDARRAEDAIRGTRIPGRLQHLKLDDADVWLDAAHNRHAIEALLPSLPGLADPFDAILVRTREDRSLADCVDLLRPHARDVALIEGPVLPALQRRLRASPEGRFLILGSFTNVAEVLRAAPSDAGLI